MGYNSAHPSPLQRSERCARSVPASHTGGISGGLDGGMVDGMVDGMVGGMQCTVHMRVPCRPFLWQAPLLSYVLRAGYTLFDHYLYVSDNKRPILHEYYSA